MVPGAAGTHHRRGRRRGGAPARPLWLILELAGVARLVNPALTRAPIRDWWYGPPYNTADEGLLYVPV